MQTTGLLLDVVRKFDRHTLYGLGVKDRAKLRISFYSPVRMLFSCRQAGLLP